MDTHLTHEQLGWRWIAIVLVTLLASLLIASVASAPAQRTPAAEGGTATGPGAIRPANFVPSDSGDIGRFAFGYVEFDWDPKAPGGVPGFDSWPPGAPPRR